VANTPPAPDDWFTVYIHASEVDLSLGAVVRFKDYDFQLLDDGVLRLVLQDRGAVYLWAPGQWLRVETKPLPDNLTPPEEDE
jgi:hypothetical protein